MKKFICMMTIAAVMLVLSVSALAQQPAASPSQDDVDKKAALYEVYTKNYQTNPPVAYAAAKEYVDKYPNDTDDIAKYLKDYVGKYEKLKLKVDLGKAIETKMWAEGFALGKQVLANEPNDLLSNLNTSWAGMQLAMSGNNASNSEAANIAMKTVPMVEAAKTLPDGKPYPDTVKNEQLGWLNYSLYLYTVKANKAMEAAGYLIKGLQYEGLMKTNPDMYIKLATVYETEYGRLQESYDAIFKGKDETPESKAALQQVKQFLEPMIDAYARAVAYSGDNAAFQQTKTAAKQRLTELYQFAKGSVDGIDAMIAAVKTKPIPPHPSVTTLSAPVAPATTSTPAASDGTVATGSGTKTGTTTPAPTTSPATTTKPAPVTTQTTPATQKPATAPAGTNGRNPRRK